MSTKSGGDLMHFQSFLFLRQTPSGCDAARLRADLGGGGRVHAGGGPQRGRKARLRRVRQVIFFVVCKDATICNCCCCIAIFWKQFNVLPWCEFSWAAYQIKKRVFLIFFCNSPVFADFIIASFNCVKFLKVYWVLTWILNSSFFSQDDDERLRILIEDSFEQDMGRKKKRKEFIRETKVRPRLEIN